jgi:2-polyprenyl-6-hydroxyphenyl methylase/3-demethylubiquinone-9 3-methyltransferase
MDQALADRLSSLPALNAANRRRTPCKICNGAAPFFDVVDFNKVCSDDLYPFGLSGQPVHYFRCDSCGFLFTRFFDDWTPEQFSRFVYNDDYIKVDGEYADIRPAREAVAMAHRLAAFGHLNMLDYGSGSGRFAEYLCGHGFEKVASYDPFSSPRRPEGAFDVITCFEVLEHSPAPARTLADIASLLAPGGCVIFSTAVQPANIHEIRANWWYVAPRNGHASIYTLAALARAGRDEGLVLHAGPGGTAFAAQDPSADSRLILATFGPPSKFFQLAAPSAGAPLTGDQKASWHGVEGAVVTPFRWTAAPEITWRLQNEPIGPGQLSITIPVQNEIRPGFASLCQLQIGEMRLPFAGNARGLTISLDLDRELEAVVKLLTPPVLRPCDLRSVTDARFLGLAIAIPDPARNDRREGEVWAGQGGTITNAKV